MRTSIIASVLALLLVAGAAVAQSPATSPAPSAGASPAVTVPGLVPSLRASTAATCPSDATWTWYLTVLGAGIEGGGSATPLGLGAHNAAGTRTLMTPAVPLPASLPPGSYDRPTGTP